jgi:hypothetical protein
MADPTTPQKLDVNAILPVIERVVLDLMTWIRRRASEKKAPPTDAEVIARAKKKVDSIVAEANAALQEFPPEP